MTVDLTSISPSLRPIIARKDPLTKTIVLLVEGIPCYSQFISDREKVVNHFLSPLISPPDSVRDYVAPLRTFAFNQDKQDPKFTMSIKPWAANKPVGKYFYTTGNIEFYLPKGATSLSSLDETPYPVVLHELCHKALAKLHLSPPTPEHALAADSDLQNLEKSGWKNCLPEVEKSLHIVRRQYKPRERTEEYLVRVPEILYLIAQKNPTLSHEDIVKIAQRDFPNLFKFYTEKFLPKLTEYNSTPSQVIN